MDLSFLSEYMVPVILGICLCVGYVVKKWVKDVDNKYIPTICCLLGVVLACWMNRGQIGPGVILGGMVSGLASTGLHQAVTCVYGTGGGEEAPIDKKGPAPL